mgnify:CR=1 FL=1
MIEASKSNIETYWTVPDDGVLPLRVTVERGAKDEATVYRLHRPPVDGGVVVFPSARKLLIDLTGPPEARHWTFDRYFKQGRHHHPAGETVLDVLGWTDPPVYDKSLTVDPADATGLVALATSPVLTVVDSAPPLGIDLVNRYTEVAKLLFAGFGTLIYRSHYDPDDVLQEVYKGLLVRNKGTCSFDPRKASFGHYVHMVCSCVLANYHRKMRRRYSMEQTGTREYRDGRFIEVDVADSNVASNDATADGLANYETAIEDLVTYMAGTPQGRTPEGRLAMTILPLHAEGMSRSEIAERIGKSKAAVSRSLAVIRLLAPRWADAR